MYALRIYKTVPHVTYELAMMLARDVEWRKKAGNALHNAVVDKQFVNQPETRDALQQVPPHLEDVTTHTQAIARWVELRPFLLAHLNDGKYAHYQADPVNAALLTAPTPTDIATLSTALEQARQAVNQHVVNDAAHNRIAMAVSIATVANSEPTNIQVLNSIQKIYSQHIHSAAVSFVIEGA